MPLLSGLNNKPFDDSSGFLFCTKIIYLYPIETTCFKTPLGIATIIGDENGIAKIAIAEEGLISEVIPLVLQEAVSQLKA